MVEAINTNINTFRNVHTYTDTHPHQTVMNCLYENSWRFSTSKQIFVMKNSTIDIMDQSTIVTHNMTCTHTQLLL